MKYNIYGFYGHHNIGDEMFILAFKHLFPTDNLTFHEIAHITKESAENTDAVIIAGGDLMNDFYGLKYREVLSKISNYKIAIGVGFSFESCTKEDYIAYFDDIVIRNQKDISCIRNFIGSKHAHYTPDLAFCLPISVPQIVKTGKTVGLFLVGSFLHNHSFKFCLLTLTNWLITSGYIVELIPMYYDDKISDNDMALNEYIYKTFSHTGKINNHGKYSVMEFIDKVSQLDFAICMRFHAHIFCTRLGVPFISIPTTRKVDIYNSEIPEDCQYIAKIQRDSTYNVLKFDVDQIKDIFSTFVDNRYNISSSLLQFNNKNELYFKSGKIQTLVANRNKRLIIPALHTRINPGNIYKKYLDIFLRNGINPATDNPLDIKSVQWLDDIADDICYTLTQDSANEYSFGTRINIRTQLKNLRDIIYYIYHDHGNKLITPKFNINYMKQDSFRGLHRAGWQFAIDSMYCLSDDYGIFLDTYLDRTFGWASSVLNRAGIIPYTNHWVGFIHHTFEEEYSANNCEAMFKNIHFINSLPLCKGIFCLSEYLSVQIRNKLSELHFNIKVETLVHPTIFPSQMFDYDKYLKNFTKRLINVGAWYRNPVSIFRIPKVDNIILSALKGKRMDSSFVPDNVLVTLNEDKLICDTNIWTKYFVKYINSQIDDFSKNLYDKLMIEFKNFKTINIRSYKNEDLLKEFISRVDILSTLADEEYDNLLSENLVFLDLIDASTANTIIESTIRCTPIIANKIQPIVEALGEDYPLYYTNLDDIPNILTEENIFKAYTHLKNMNKEGFRVENFLKTLTDSKIFGSL